MEGLRGRDESDDEHLHEGDTEDPNDVQRHASADGEANSTHDEDLEVGFVGSKHGSNEVAVKSSCTFRKLRALIACAVLFLVIFILFKESLTEQLWRPNHASPTNVACDALLSAPYSNSRRVGTEYCVTHKGQEWKNLAVDEFLSPQNRLGEGSVRFLVIGDFGRDGFCCQRDVAVEMDRVVQFSRSTFVIGTGDLFYDYGILSSNDEQTHTSFLDVYNQSYLKELEFFSVLGNHEYRGSVSAVLEFSANEERFTMDRRYYSRIVEADSIAVHFIYIDTTPMIESYRQSGYDDQYDTMLKREDGIVSQWEHIEEQMQWIERRLKNTQLNFTMKIVIGHHPIYGLKSYEGEDRSFLQTRLAPLLEQYNVTAYFAGHDHNLQLVQPAQTAHFISGAGSKIRTVQPYTADTHNDTVRFVHIDQGFLACTIYEKELRVAVVNKAGELLDSAVIPAR